MTRPRVCIDRVLPRDLLRPQRIIARAGVSRAIVDPKKLWVTGSTLRVRFMGGTPTEQGKAKQQALWWSEHANLILDFNNAPDAEIRVAFDGSDGAWSYVGTDARGIPAREPTMNLGFLDGGTAAHEFGHAIGLHHEHQNPKGGIEWNEEVVIQDLSGPPNNWTEEQIRHNVLSKYRLDQVRGTDFDQNSIMLYFFPDTWVKTGKGTKENEVLSDLDKSFIAAEYAYPRDRKKVIEIGVNANDPTSAEIGQLGEEDIFTFMAKQRGRYIVSTGGKTDLVMKLFGPERNTALVAEDDDSGVALNARIVADLIPGRYTVQIRHFNLSNGTGSYNVSVRMDE